ncbi:hypothetical protein A0H81_14560 [Grifola frondosa]|uniref:Uncharacterized protein n=1 Tax=Grifola frondosa TaxID=5627 RepID=A0A1C7LN71_GRIFR|nr:hypothetical protein A0H81_14560 [Grifola frondosa]
MDGGNFQRGGSVYAVHLYCCHLADQLAVTPIHRPGQVVLIRLDMKRDAGALLDISPCLVVVVQQQHQSLAGFASGWTGDGKWQSGVALTVYIETAWAAADHRHQQSGRIHLVDSNIRHLLMGGIEPPKWSCAPSGRSSC